MRLSQSLQWALGVSLAVLLLLLSAATPTQSRFIAKRETLNVDMGALDAFTADPDIVNASSESSSLVRKPGSELEEQLELTTPTTTTTSTSTEAPKPAATAANASQELSQETVNQQLQSNVTESLTEQQQEPEEQVQLKSEQVSEQQKELNSDKTVETVQNKTLLKEELPSTTTTTAATAVKPVDLESLQNKTLITEDLKENELQGSTTTTTEAAASDVKPAEQQQRQETDQVMELTTATTTTTTTTESFSTTTERAASTQRSEDHARSMHYASSTESASFPASVTPMKLFALPMHTTKASTATSTSTTPPQLLAALLHAGVTVAPSASHENAIEEGEGEQLHPQPEKRGKFISDNATNAQQLLLPNAAEVWSLAAMKMIPTTTTTSATTSSTFSNNVEPRHNLTEEQHKEKNLLDWQQIMLMHENHTENSMMSTTLDATEAATQPTTLRLDATALGESEMETSASRSEESNSNMAITAQEQNAKAKPKDEYEVTEDLTAAVNAKPVNETDKPVELTELAKLTDEVTLTTTTTTEAAATAEPELTTTTSSTTTTTTTTTTTAAPTSALNGTPHTNEMAMKATKEEEKEEGQAHENNENGDKTNDVDSDDVINVSVSVSVPTSETTTTTTTLAATERAPITVSTRTAGELSTTTEVELETTPPPPPSTPTPTPSLTLSHTPSTPRTVHAKVDEQLATTTITTLIINTTTPETVQISNEVNLDTILVKNVTNNNNENNLLLPETTTTTTIPPQTTSTTTTIRTEEINNSETLQINNNSSENITETETTTETATTSTTTTTTATPPTVLLTDAKANSELTEHENSLETNNIGEVISAITTTTSSTTTAATTRTTTEASAAAGAVNELEESTVTPTTTTTAAAGATSRTAIKPGELEEYDEDEDEQQQIDRERVTVNKMADTTTTTTTTTTTEATTSSSTTTTTTPKPTTTTTEEPLISLLDDSSTTTTTIVTPTPITTTPLPPTTTTTTTETPTTRPALTTTTAAATEPIYSSTNNNNNKMLPIGETTTPLTAVESTTPFFMPSPTELDHSSSNASGGGSGGTDVNVIIAITVSIVGVIALILLVAFLYLMRKRQKQTSYGQRCRPVSLDAYSLDNVSVLGSVRRKGGRDATRASKRTYGNAAFDDPSLRHNLLSASELGKFVERRSSIFEEFRDVPQIIARADEVPTGCEDKNRYANVIPLPETRVVLQRQGDDDKTEYINANYVRGPRDAPNYYIACQAPLESTTGDFWRMIWEQQSRVIVQATDLNENGIERCAEYLPPSVTLDNHSNYGDYQVTLKHREVKDKYAISTLMLKRVDGDECRELTHYWYKWPETGVPLEEAPIIAMLLEARSSLKSYALEQANELKEKSSTLTLKSLDPAMDDEKKLPAEEAVSTSSGASNEINGNVTNGKVATRSQQGPLTIHCSPGTGRTGTIIACDMAIRSLETPKRSVDIPQLVYYVRRGRASAVQTKEQYEFIYKVANMYATKITNLSNDN